MQRRPKQQLVEIKKAAYGVSDDAFHGDVKQCSEELSSKASDMIHLLDRLEKEKPNMPVSRSFGTTP